MSFIMRVLPVAAGVGLLCSPFAAKAQKLDDDGAPVSSHPTYLINVDTPHIPAKGRLHFSADVRPFGTAENNTYSTLGLEFGFTNSMAILLRAGGASRRTITPGAVPLLAGGREYEAGVRWMWNQRGDTMFGVGASLLIPSSRPDNRAALGGEALLGRRFGKNLTLYATPKATFGSALFATLGGGAQFQFEPNIALIGDVQIPFIGQNGFNTTTGDSIKKSLWGLGVRYNPSAFRGRASLDFGVTNGVGRTLGLSAYSAAAGSAAFYFSVSLRP